MSSFAVLDLGSSRIKLAVFDSEGRLLTVLSGIVPKYVRDENGQCESDPLVYCERVDKLLQDAQSHYNIIKLAMTTQRSSFLLWDKESGKPVTRLISWQDTRGDAWCDANKASEAIIQQATGLMLTPYYIGPKLAVLLSEDLILRQQIDAGELLFGTLDCFLLWRWTQGKCHQIDLTMAARSLLVDLKHGNWSQDLCDLFHVPMVILPTITASTNLNIFCDHGMMIVAMIADQSAAALPFLSADNVVINLGTGGFVLGYVTLDDALIPGYLATVVCYQDNQVQFAREATLNGIGTALRTARDLTFIETENVFCIPDFAGLGSPYWRSDIGLTFSIDEGSLTTAQRYSLIIEGIVFRLATILRDWYGDDLPSAITITGGQSRKHTMIIQGLADCLQHDIALTGESETTILGVSTLIKQRMLTLDSTTIRPNNSLYFQQKWQQWREWVATVLYA